MDLLVPVDGGQVWAQDTGGPGSPVVLMHPGWGDSTIWDPVIDRLTGAPRVIRYDTRGFGRSPAPAVPFTQLGDLIAVLDYIGIPRAVLGAHSGGAATALALALAQPERVGALVLAAPGVSDYPWPLDDPYWAEFDRLFAAGDREGLVALGLRTWAAAGPDPVAQAQVRGAVAAFFRQGDYERPEPPAWTGLGQISAPAVLAIGELEYPMVADCAGLLAARIPGCRTVRVAASDHLLPLRAPEVLAELIDSATASRSGHSAGPDA